MSLLPGEKTETQRIKEKFNDKTKELEFFYFEIYTNTIKMPYDEEIISFDRTRTTAGEFSDSEDKKNKVKSTERLLRYSKKSKDFLVFPNMMNDNSKLMIRSISMENRTRVPSREKVININ
jgi:hypothetical protein